MAEFSPFSPVSPISPVLDADYNKFINPVVRCFNIAHLYTRTQLKQNEGLFKGYEPVYTIYLVKQEATYPPFIVVDETGLVNPSDPSLSLIPIEEKAPLKEYFYGLPANVNKNLVCVLSQHGVYIPEKKRGRKRKDEEEEDQPKLDIADEFSKIGAVYKPLTKIRDIYSLDEVNWQGLVDSLITWGIEKDSRLCLIQKSQLLRGIDPRANPHTMISTNPGTGKSLHYKQNGKLYDKVTKNSFIGFAKSPREIFPGTVNGSTLPIGIDQIESGNWGIMDFLFNVMEYGEATVSSGSVEFIVKTRSPISVLANPSTSEYDKEGNFGQLLSHLTENPAIGRRIGAIIYGTDYKTITGKTSTQDIEKWTKAAQYFRAVEEYATPILEEIFKDKRIWDYLSLEITGYSKRVNELIQGIHNQTIYTFFKEHAKAGQSRVRAVSLSIALVEYLDKIALNNYDLDQIIDHAENYIPDIIGINLESISNLIYNVDKDAETFSKSYYESQPEYIQHIINAVICYRRQGTALNENIYLTSIDYDTFSPTYTHLSKCIHKLLDRKRGLVDLNNKFKQFFGFSFTPKDNDLLIHLDPGFKAKLKYIQCASKTGEKSESSENGENVEELPKDYPTADQYQRDKPIIDTARGYLKHNGGFCEITALVSHLRDHNYETQEFKRLKPYSLIFRFDKSKVHLLEGSQ